MVAVVLGFLPVGSLRSLLHVCRSWTSIIESDEPLWCLLTPQCLHYCINAKPTPDPCCGPHAGEGGASKSCRLRSDRLMTTRPCGEPTSVNAWRVPTAPKLSGVTLCW
jgi:hypothetical protein